MLLNSLIISAGVDFSKFILNEYLNKGVRVKDEEDKLVCLVIYTFSQKSYFSQDCIELVKSFIDEGDVSSKIVSFLFRVKNSNKIELQEKLSIISQICDKTEEDQYLCDYIDEVCASMTFDSWLSLNRSISYLLELKKVKRKKNILLLKKTKSKVIAKIRSETEKSVSHTRHRINNQNIVLLLEHIPFNIKTGAHLRQINWIIEGLLSAKNDLKVLLIITNELYRKDSLYWKSDAKGVAEYIKDRAVDNSRFDVICGGEVSENSFGKIAKILFKFNPSAIVKFGGVVESKAFDFLIVDRFPVIYSQFNSLNVPDLEYDLHLSNSKLSEKKEKWEQRFIPLNHKVRPRTHRIKKNLKLITVLGNDRLDVLFGLYSSSVILEIVKILDSCHSWTFVGSRDLTVVLNKIPDLKKHLDSGRLICVSHVSDLFRFYDDFDFFIMPPNARGGGGGLLIAAGAGLAVLIPATLDGASVIPECYIYDSELSFYDIYKNFSSDLIFLNENIMKTQKELLKQNPKTAGEVLLRQIMTAENNFLQRISK